ncbi:diaminopimelate epimerase [Tepidiforma sp.]|uniref:diaminopimelate epimerase n=1 Tax=Tepidiforma sp. TaxID=2682230 RepID=UPI002ADD93C0|nr:diaminopimelate epimerase [Tepidiforma sp.]
MRVTKMHGLGNDYVYLAPASESEHDWPELSRRISDRHFGVGSDGLILALPSTIADVRMRMFNADGSEAEMCGNGIRCLVKFAIEEGLVPADRQQVTVETLAGIKTLTVYRENGVVTAARVDMGPPSFDPTSLPAAVEGPGPIIDLPITIDGIDLHLTLVSMGNPHAIHYLDSDPDDFPLERIGPLVEHHPLFPKRVNFQVVQVLGPGEVKHRVWERGSGITLASGTSAAAVAAASHLRGFTGQRIVDHMPGGDLVLEWDGAGSVFMTGPAVRVFDAEWYGP